MAHREGLADWVGNLPKWRWVVVEVSGFLMTSDRPLVLNGPQHDDEVVHTIEIALSPSHLLMCICPQWNEEETDRDSGRVTAETFNRRLITCRPRYVYSALPVGRLPGPRFDYDALMDQYLSASFRRPQK